MKESYGQLSIKLIELIELRIKELESSIKTDQELLAEYRKQLAEAKKDYELWRLYFDTQSN